MNICALATATGGAIAVIRVSGPQAITITNSIYCGRRALTDVATHSLCYGTISDVDDVLVSVFRAPNSYTGEDSTEISCHGSAFIVQQVLERLMAAGCRMAQPGEFTQRAYLNGKLDLSQAEAVADLIAATNKTQHDIAFAQMRGQYSDHLKQLREQLIKLTALLELELDFSEEDVEFANRAELQALTEEIISEIRRLANSFQQGNALKNGVPVAIVGAPNVGKSTLLNALLGDDRAIVSPIQGTTRDVIEDTLIINDICFRFIDTAGVRETEDSIERMGIERSVQAAQRAQIVILLTEPGVDFLDESICSTSAKVLRIVNKTDEFSALNGIGIEDLKQRLVAMATPNTEFVVTNARHYEALNNALRELEPVLDKGVSDSVITSQHLRRAISNLGAIYGEEIEYDREALASIFAHFCIGK